MAQQSVWALSNGSTIRCLRAGTMANATQWNREIALIGTEWRWVKAATLPLADDFRGWVVRNSILYDATTDHTESTQLPSIAIDAVVCDLMERIAHYSDAFFDADWLHLQAAELFSSLQEMRDIFNCHSYPPSHMRF